MGHRATEKDDTRSLSGKKSSSGTTNSAPRSRDDCYSLFYTHSYYYNSKQASIATKSLTSHQLRRDRFIVSAKPLYIPSHKHNKSIPAQFLKTRFSHNIKFLLACSSK